MHKRHIGSRMHASVCMRSKQQQSRGVKSSILFILLAVSMFCFAGCGDDPDVSVPAVWEGEDIVPPDSSPESTGQSGEDAGALESETAPAEENDDIVTITISAAGDVTLGNTQTQDYPRSFRNVYDEVQDPGYFFRNVLPIFENDDMTIVNFEGTLTFSEEKQEKDFNIKGDPEYVAVLTEGSVEAVSFGNNHRRDYLDKGSDDTVEAFTGEEIAYAYDNVYGIYETKGIKIGFVSVNETSQGRAVEKYLKEGIAWLKEQEADLILACCHWGIEGDNYPEEYQTLLGRMCIDWGADLVLGHHPHVLQGVDVYKGKYIVYSLGNFCFGANRNPSDKDTMIFQQTFTFVNGEKQEDDAIRVIPCYLSSVRERNNFQPTPAEGDEAVRIIDRINTYSEQFGLRFDKDGYLTGQ